MKLNKINLHDQPTSFHKECPLLIVGVEGLRELMRLFQAVDKQKQLGRAKEWEHSCFSSRLAH